MGFSFTGIKINSMVNLSHLFYADDAIFLGQWSELNIDSLVRVLDCFFRASGLRINMCKRLIHLFRLKVGRKYVQGSKLERRGGQVGVSLIGQDPKSNKASWVKWNKVLGYEDWTGAVADINEDGFIELTQPILVDPVQQILEDPVVPRDAWMLYKTFHEWQALTISRGLRCSRTETLVRKDGAGDLQLLIDPFGVNVKAMKTTEYCPASKIQRMEQELWTLTLKGDDIEAYNNRFHELALMCHELVPTEKKKVERYVRGFPERIKEPHSTKLILDLHEAITLPVNGRASSSG
ncbi:putative reverse transcriptase domain-containing protein [Tanacetum coccineum]